jgi:NH3-dependent NAD+ synthetase
MRKEMAGQGTLMDSMTIDYEQASNRIVNFIRQKVAEAGKDDIYIGISGGLDFTVVSIFAVKAIWDPSKVYAIYLIETVRRNLGNTLRDLLMN